MKTRMLTMEERTQVVGMQEARMKCKDIGEKLNMPYSIVSTILKSWKLHDTIDYRPTKKGT